MSEISNSLVDHGFAITPNFLSPSEAATLRHELQAADQGSLFRPANIGRGSTTAQRTDIRGDRILWLEPPHPILTRFEALKQELNQTLFLGLRDLECHFAIYPPGGFYKKHLDRHQTSDARVVSLVLYLNESWSESDGGQLHLFTRNHADTLAAVVPPQAGTLACFMSGEIWHEVMPTNRERLSITGWLRR